MQQKFKNFLIDGLLLNQRVLEHRLKKQPESFWVKRGGRSALKLFKLASKRVPAYKDFLKKNKVNADKIKTAEDLKALPPLDKNNYLSFYSREKLTWDGKFNTKQWVISTTSGSTGEPFYFPRANFQDWQYALFAELYLRSNFQIQKRKTLYIVGFPMGAWIGGLFTYEALKQVAEKGYPLSIITPGINKLEILKAVKNLGKEFDQIIIGSYGPFLKDIIDDGARLGVNWKKYNLGFVLSAEGFSEQFRDYILKTAGVTNVYKGSLNHYGTVDLGTMSYETPLSILIRREALKNEVLYKDIFMQTSKLPTLTQYFPELFYFESDNSSLYCSAFSGYPLVRYDLKDHGNILSLTSVEKMFNNHGINLRRRAKSVDIVDTWWNLPLVHVYERSDFSVSFFAFQVYPETVRKALQVKEFHKTLTGKFNMQVKFDGRSNQYLEINAELKAGVKPNQRLRHLAVRKAMEYLIRENSEYRRTHEEYPNRVVPKFVFWPYEHAQYFRPGIKQKWVLKN